MMMMDEKSKMRQIPRRCRPVADRAAAVPWQTAPPGVPF